MKIMMQNLFRIGQVCKLYGITPDTLRHYEKKGLLFPVVDSENGYRYYSAEQLDVVEMILNSKNIGIPLEEIRQVIDTENMESYLDMLKRQKQELGEKMKELSHLQTCTNEKIAVLDTLTHFQNDYSFKKIQYQKDQDITIYQMKLDTLFSVGSDPQQTDGMDLLQTWRFYRLTDDGEITEDMETAGFSFPPTKKITELEQKFLMLVAKENATKKRLNGRTGKISFWGTDAQLINYLKAIYERGGIINHSFFVKMRYSLLRKEKEHQHFVDIYFQE